MGVGLWGLVHHIAHTGLVTGINGVVEVTLSRPRPLRVLHNRLCQFDSVVSSRRVFSEDEIHRKRAPRDRMGVRLGRV